MFVFQCLFCDHNNRPGAKFCEECGSPMHLRLCKHCQAINDRVALTCHQCGAKLVAGSVAAQDKGAESVDELRRKLANKASRVPEQLAEVAAGQPNALRANAPALFRRRQPAHEAVSPSTSRFVAQQERISRTVGSVLPLAQFAWMQRIGRVRTPRRVLFALLLTALVGVGYYLYRLPQQITVHPTASAPTESAPAEGNVGGTPTASVAVTAGAVGAPTVDPPASALPTGFSEQSRGEADRAVAAPIIGDPDAAVSQRNNTVQPSAAAVQPARRTTRVYVQQSDVGACTEDVAALGLCNPSEKREGN